MSVSGNSEIVNRGRRLPFSFVTFSLYIHIYSLYYSKSVLSERAELKKVKHVWITSGKAL